MINNRQAGRRRGRGGNGSGNGGGQRQGGNPGRPDNGNRIDNRARGNASQLHEKYKNLAADAQRQGDRVNTEYYLQFADHYFRVLSETRSRFEENQPRRQREDQRDGAFDDFEGNTDDAEYGDEGEPARAAEQSLGNEGGEPPRRERNRDGRNARDGGDHRAPRRDGSERQAGDRIERPLRGEQPERAPRDPAPVAAANDVTAPETVAAEVVEPRRRTRTRRERPVEPEAGEAASFDAAILPPSVAPAAAADEAPAEEKPRRRRVRTAAAEASQAS